VDVLAPVLNDGSAEYTPGISENRSGTSKFYHSDYLGSVSRETDSSGSTTSTKTYDAFGNPESSTGSSSSPFGFAGSWGYQSDSDSGLMPLGHRYYDSSTGRFLARDPVQDGRNWYGYAGNDPTAFVDPLGLRLYASYAGNLGQELRGIGGGLVGVAKGMFKSVLDGVIGIAYPGGPAAYACSPQKLAEAWNSDVAIWNTLRKAWDGDPYSGGTIIGGVLGSCAVAAAGEVALGGFGDGPGEPGGGGDGGVPPKLPKRPFKGEPGTVASGVEGVRRFGADGFPEVDVDYADGHNPTDHAHDWGRPPINENRGRPRPIRDDDPQLPGR